MQYPSWFISEYSDSWPGKVRQAISEKPPIFTDIPPTGKTDDIGGLNLNTP